MSLVLIDFRGNLHNPHLKSELFVFVNHVSKIDKRQSKTLRKNSVLTCWKYTTKANQTAQGI